MISSTALDLPDHRKEAIDACLRLGLFPKAMEHLPALDADAVEVSMKMVDEADVYIGIFAWRYGHIPQGHSNSITEMELNRAKERKIPILVFLMHEDHLITINQVELAANAQKRLAALKRRVSEARNRREFRSPIELRGEIMHALGELKPSLGMTPLDEARPVISSVPDVATFLNTESEIVTFAISDEYTAATKLILSVVNSTNLLLIPMANVQFAGSGGTRLMIIIPAQNQSGTSAVTIRVTNERDLWSERTFKVTVILPPSPP